MRAILRLVCLSSSVVILMLVAATSAIAGGVGQYSCPKGFTSYLIPDGSAAGVANGKLQSGAHGQLAPTHLPAGQYAVASEGTLGPNNNPPNAPYWGLCRQDGGKAGFPILATAQGAYSLYEVPQSYMSGDAITTAWLPAGNYEAITGDSPGTYTTVRTVAAQPPSSIWTLVLEVLAACVLCVLLDRWYNRPSALAGTLG